MSKLSFTPISIGTQPATSGGLSFTPIDLGGPEEPKPTDKVDVKGAIKRGVQTSLNPFGVDEKEYSKPRSGTEAAIETAANISSDIVTSVGAGAIAGGLAGSVVPGAGTAVGALAGAGLGIYRALGYEDLMSRSKGESFNPARAALNVAVEVNPLLKVGGRALKFGTQGTLQALQTLAYGGSGTAALVSGAIGGGVGALAHGKSPSLQADDKVKQITGISTMMAEPDMSPADIQRLVNVLGDGDNSFQIARIAHDKAKANATYEDSVSSVVTRPDFFDVMQDPASMKQAFDAVPDSILSAQSSDLKDLIRLTRAEMKREGIKPGPGVVEQVARNRAKQTVMETEAGSFARWILKKPSAEMTPELFAEAKKKLGATALDQKKAYDIYRTQHYLREAATEAADRAATEGSGIKDPLGMSVFRFFSDLKFAARAVDRVAGTNLDGLTDSVSYQKHKHGAFMFGVTKKTNSLLNESKKTGLDRNKIVELLEAGADKTADSAEHRKILTGFRELFDEMREFGVKNGLDIARRDNYVTSLAQEPADLITAIRRRAVSFENGSAKIKPEALQDLDLHKVLTHVTGVEINSDGDAVASLIRRALNKLDSVETIKDQDGFEAIAAFQRKGDIPDFVREKDIGKIMIRYGNNLSKSVHMEPVIRLLQAQVPALEAIGMESSAAYLKKYVQHLSGRPSEFIGWISAGKTRWKTSIDEFIDKKELTGLSASTFNAAKVAPDFLSWSMSLIYPNYLGLSPRSVIRNWTQPLAVTAPELGGAYGYKMTLKATMEMLRDKKKGVNLEEVLKELGHVPGEFVGEGLNPVAGALRTSSIGPFVTKVDEVGKVMMWAYSKSDMINRYVTLKLSKNLTKDMLGGLQGGSSPDEQAAMRVLKQLAPGVKSTIYRLVKEQKLDNLEEVLSRYLLSKTQFNYGPHALSEYGRTMGRFFSMFTKWPAMVAGDIHELAVTKQYRRAAERYLAPWAALGVLNQWYESTEDSPRRRALVGKSLLPLSPLTSLEVSTPPSLEIIGGVGKSFMHAASMDFEKASKQLAKSLEPVIPGVGLLKGTENIIYNIGLNKDAPWSNRK